MPQSLNRSFWKHRWADQSFQDKAFIFETNINLFSPAYILEDQMPHGKHGGLGVFYPMLLWENMEVKGSCKRALGRQIWVHRGSSLPHPPFIFAKTFVILCVDDSWLSGGSRQGSSPVLVGESAMCIQSPGNTFPGSQRETVPWGGEEMDLRGGLESRPWVGQPGGTRGTRRRGAWPIASLLARGWVYRVTLCLEKEFRELPRACCVEWKHTQHEKILKLAPLEVRF